MRTKFKSAILVTLISIFLSACGLNAVTAEHFDLGFFGECVATDSTVICVGNTEIAAYSIDGELICKAENTLTEPQLSAAGEYALVSGENEIYLFDGENIQHNNVNNKIMSTSINANGYTAVCTEEAGYKGSVTVFDAELESVYKWYCASGYLIKAALSEKNTLAVLTANEKGSTVHVFMLDSEIEQYSVFIEKELCFDIGWMGEKLCLMSESAIYFADESNTERHAFGGTLGEYAISEKYAVLEELNGDGTGTVLSFDAKGRLIGFAECEMLRGLAVNDDRIAVISGGEAILFNERMNELFSADARGARQILLCGRTVLLLKDCGITAYNNTLLVEGRKQ